MGTPQRAENWLHHDDYASFLSHQERGMGHWFITRDYFPDERAIRENDKRIVLADLLGTNANGVGLCNHEACWRRRKRCARDLDYRGKNQRLIKSMSLNRCCPMYLYYKADLDQGSDGRIKEPPRPAFEDASTYLQRAHGEIRDVVFPYRFRVYDDDDDLHYEGWQTEEDFEPLDDFARENVGATYMKTSNRGGPWAVL